MSSEPVTETFGHRVLLGDVAQRLTVGHVGPMADQYVEDGVPFLRSKDVAPFRVDTDDLKRIPLDFHERLAKSALAPGDVVIVRTGRPGAAAVIPDSLPVANCSDLVIVRPGPLLDPRFLAYYINSQAQQHVAAHTVGAVQQHFNVGSARTMEIVLPHLDEQARIANVLGSLDDKIESNGRLADALQRVASAQFHRLFGELAPDGSTSERIGTLGDLVQVTMGQSPPSSSYSADASTGLLLVQGMGGFGSRFPTSDIYTSAPTKRASVGDTLMTVRAPVGAVNVAHVELCLGRGVAGFTSPRPAFTEFLIRALEPRWASQESGTIFSAVNGKQIVGLPVALPFESEQDDFERFASPLVAQLWALHRETETLTAIRDTLLPRLVTGAIRVSDASVTELAQLVA